MAFDINEARQIIEDAKKRGLISAQGSKPAPAPVAPPASTAKAPASSAVIPDWLKDAIANPPAPGETSSRDSIFSSGN
jgi:hypothetical protein